MPARRPWPLLAALMLMSALVLPAGCGGSSGDPPARATATATPATDPAVDPQTGCSEERPKGEQVPLPERPQGRLDASKTHVARFDTTCGSFEITLAADRAPVTAASFASLVRQRFYDGLTFHRVIAGFVVQGGDPKGDGTGGPGYTVREAPPSNLAYSHGIVAMAKTGAEPAGTSGSQFFIVVGEQVDLPPDYALAGRVSKGLDVVDRIGVVPTDPRTERPETAVVIRSARMVTR